ncbi:uncharacterized protein [Haliotis cracherodii]|uniref:uncharacterized protein n=1 Tax=Haliotis cracherodii TaxID=6455 RepID=UPI0039EB72D5
MFLRISIYQPVLTSKVQTLSRSAVTGSRQKLVTPNTTFERLVSSWTHTRIQENFAMDEQDARSQGDFIEPDPPNSDSAVIVLNHPENSSEASRDHQEVKSYLHMENSTSLDEGYLSQRKRILLSSHKQILAKVIQQRLVSKNLCQMLNQSTPTTIPDGEQSLNDTDTSPLIVSVRPISQTVSGSMKLSYTIKDGELPTALQEARQRVECVEQTTISEVLQHDPSLPAEAALQEAKQRVECVEQTTISEVLQHDPCLPAEAALQEAKQRVECVEQTTISEVLQHDPCLPAEAALQEAKQRVECVEQTLIPEVLQHDPSLPAEAALQEAKQRVECVEQTTISEVLQHDPSLPAEAALQEARQRVECVEQTTISEVLQLDPSLPAEDALQEAGAECLELMKIPESFQDDPNFPSGTFEEIHDNSTSSQENLGWVRSLGSEQAIMFLYSSPNVSSIIQNTYDDEIIVDQYLQPVKKRKVSK